MELICLGDSLTFGYGVRRERCWTELAARFLGIRPERDAFAAALAGTDVSRFFLGLDRGGLLALLCE